MNLKKSFTILLALSLASCATKIPDVEICSDAGSLGAFCVTTISGKEREVAKEAWDKERFGYLCMSANSYAEIKKTILELCHNQKCVEAIEKKVNEVDGNITKATKKHK